MNEGKRRKRRSAFVAARKQIRRGGKEARGRKEGRRDIRKREKESGQGGSR